MRRSRALRRPHRRVRAEWFTRARISVAPVSPEIAAQARVPAPVRGVLVSDVTPAVPATEARAQRRDHGGAVSGARRAINTPSDLQQVLRTLRDGDTSASACTSYRSIARARIVNLQLASRTELVLKKARGFAGPFSL